VRPSLPLPLFLLEPLLTRVSTPCRYIFTNEQGQEEEREAVLSDDDKVWCEVRHMHMKDALDKLIADFRSYAGEHGGTYGGTRCVALPLPLPLAAVALPRPPRLTHFSLPAARASTT